MADNAPEDVSLEAGDHTPHAPDTTPDHAIDLSKTIDSLSLVTKSEPSEDSAAHSEAATDLATGTVAERKKKCRTRGHGGQMQENDGEIRKSARGGKKVCTVNLTYCVAFEF